jgi:protein SCO1/2
VLKNKINWVFICLILAFSCTEHNGKTTTDTIYQRIPSFTFFNEDSVLVTNKTFAGKVWISEFFFASCPSICPIMNTQLKNVEKALKAYQKEIQYLSFTIDPTNDKPSVLKAHKRKLGIDNPNWSFLSGNEAFTHQLGIEHFLIFAGREEEALGGYAHSGAFTLVDKKGYVRGVYEVVQPDLSVNKKEFQRLINDTKTLFNYDYKFDAQ